MTTMTLAAILTDAQTVVTEFQSYIVMAIALGLGMALIPRIKRWVTKR